jgi:hypothetical protein
MTTTKTVHCITTCQPNIQITNLYSHKTGSSDYDHLTISTTVVREVAVPSLRHALHSAAVLVRRAALTITLARRVNATILLLTTLQDAEERKATVTIGATSCPKILRPSRKLALELVSLDAICRFRTAHEVTSTIDIARALGSFIYAAAVPARAFAHEARQFAGDAFRAGIGTLSAFLFGGGAKEPAVHVAIG